MRALKTASPLALAFAFTLPPVIVAFATQVVEERTQALFFPWFLFALVR